MARFLVFSDLHAHPFRQFSVNNSRLLNCVNVIEDVFYLADLRKCVAILFTGDLNHEQGKIDTLTMNLLISKLKEMQVKFPHIKIYGISGNHDHKGKNILDNPAPSALSSLEDAVPEVFNLIDNCAISVAGVNIFGIPYYEFPEDFYTVLGKMKGLTGAGEVNILLTHQTPSGSIDPIPSQIDPKHEDFRSFNLVLNGHIHRRQMILDNFLTVGSPLHQDLGDVGQEKGVILIDTEKNWVEAEFIPLEYPRFIRVKYGESVPAGCEHDYLVQDPPDIDQKDSSVDLDKFNSNLTPNDIVKAYGEHHQLDESLIELGQSLLWEK